MFEEAAATAPPQDPVGPPLRTERLQLMLAELGRPDPDLDDAARIDQIRALEEIKAAAAATQARLSVDFAASQQQAASRPDAAEPAKAAATRAREAARSVAGQVGLAKRESPARARRYLGFAQILVTELVHTLAALQAGEVTEWQAMLIARETAWLSLADRKQVDVELAGRLAAMGDRQVEAEAKKLAYRLDPHGAAQRSANAHRDRRVTLRPAPDTMARLSGLLPVTQGVAAYAALTRHADTLVAQGDPRTRGQIMADTLLERVTGQTTADATATTVNLVMTDRALFNLRDTNPDTDTDTDPDTDGGGADEPAHLDGYGPIPAELARRLLLDAPDGTQVWLRRMYAHPQTGALVAMESRGRCFEHALRQFLILRDHTCRTPWCDAPIRHADHPRPADEDGKTSADNGQGLCAGCNYTKQATGWRARPGPHGAGHSVVTTTPTGHTYTSQPPDPPGTPPGGKPPPGTDREPPTPHPADEPPSILEAKLRDLILAA